MKTLNGTTRLSVVALAVAALVNATAARADDEEVKALTQPTSTAQLGVYNANGSSAKFGEYTGINKSGANGIGQVNIRGGDAYQQEGGTNRWSIIGTDLGLTSQSLGATFSNQGSWKLGFEYDELQHNLSDTYQTPYVGVNGGNSFTLPAGFGTIANTTTGMTAGQLAAFHNLDISTTRKNTALNGELALGSRMSIDFDIKHLDQKGAKLMGFGAAGWTAAAAGAGTTPARALLAPTGEVPSILPMPTNYTTDTLRVGLNWKGEKAHLSTNYTGSFSRDGYDRVTFDTWAGANMSQTMGTAPDNDFHQLSVAGGYQLAPKTKLTANVSYGRNTQNVAYVFDAFMMQPSPGVLPATSANGLVETKHYDVKVTDQSFKDWVLAAGVKQDVRDNKSPSNIYSFYSIGGHQTSYPNAPRSWDKTLYEVSGDYKMSNDRHIKIDYGHEDMKRWCNSYAAGGLGAPTAFADGTNCVVATKQSEDKLGATYRAKAGEDVDYRVGYSLARRITTSDPNARTPFLSVNGGPAGVPGGTNGGDFPGFYPAFDASRTQNILKGAINWQANEKLSFGLNGRGTIDRYDSTYGEQSGYSVSLNLDANYAHSDSLTFTSYLSRQQRQRSMTDLQAVAAATSTNTTQTTISRPANATWSDTLMEDDMMIGLGVKQRGLMKGKLDLSADLTYVYTDISYNTTFNYQGSTFTGLTCASPQFNSCGDLPNIVSEMTQVKLTGSYQIDKSSRVMLSYIYQMLNASDYYYNGYQTGSTPNTLLPTNQQAGAYSINLVTVAYIYNF
jgi:MtrB/PioB family decaheme-associated outer membrane protein